MGEGPRGTKVCRWAAGPFFVFAVWFGGEARCVALRTAAFTYVELRWTLPIAPLA